MRSRDFSQLQIKLKNHYELTMTLTEIAIRNKNGAARCHSSQKYSLHSFNSLIKIPAPHSRVPANSQLSTNNEISSQRS